MNAYEKDSKTEFKFFQETDRGRQAVEVRQDVFQRCRDAYSSGHDNVGLSGTIDIKMVAVQDGRNLWHYHRTRGVDLTKDNLPMRWRASSSRSGPVAAIAIGLAGVALGILRAANDGQGPTSVGGVTALVGGGLGAVGAMWLSTIMPPSPNDALCMGYPMASEGVGHPKEHEAGSFSSFSVNLRAEASDPMEELRRQLEARIIGDFLLVLTDVKAPLAPVPVSPTVSPVPPPASQPDLAPGPIPAP